MGHLLLTGATGLLGRYLMRDIMEKGIPLAVLVRPSRRKSPAIRIEAAMRAWEERLGRKLPRPVVLEGDISLPDFGLSPEQIMWTAENCDAMLHNAASLSFVTTGRDAEPWKSNVGGTQNAIEFCRQAGIRKFFHVSTAYVAGTRMGHVYENELDVGQEFGNCYEESKVAAEKLVREAKHFDSTTFFRPGIIIGDSVTGMTTTYHNFYVAVGLAKSLADHKTVRDETGLAVANEVHFNMNGNERKHLVPVDWVSAVMAHVIDQPQHYGKTYHLTPSVPITMRLIRDVLEAEVGFYGVEFYGAGDRRADSSENEEVFFQHMEVYNSYWRDDPQYDTTNTRTAAPHLPCPIVDRTLLRHLTRVAIENKFSWKDPVVEELPVAAKV
ncbi:MAG: NAD-dependent epimerase/dehydratase family protein [Planctomycetota bacterium]|nr:MAG: NAD-dependent epimerase/dehydratase family protein [Planctomycetota bacterium]